MAGVEGGREGEAGELIRVVTEKGGGGGAGYAGLCGLWDTRGLLLLWVSAKGTWSAIQKDHSGCQAENRLSGGKSGGWEPSNSDRI